MKPKKSNSIRAPGQRSLLSTFIFRPTYQCSATKTSKNSKYSPVKNNPGSNLSLTHFLNSKLHSSTSVLPIHKDEDTLSLVKKDNIRSAENQNSLEQSIVKEKKLDREGACDERPNVIDDSVFKLFNDSGENIRKRPCESVTAASMVKSSSVKQSQNHLLVLGDDPRPKSRARQEAPYSDEKPRPVYNHYENGTGWWEPEREGVDSDEVGNSAMWEGIGSTTLGGLNWN